MKKTIFIALFSTVLLVGCASENEEEVSSSESKRDVQTSVVQVPDTSGDTTQNSGTGDVAGGQTVDKFDGQEQIGEGTLTLVDSSGNTVNGKELNVPYKAGTTPVEVGIETTDIDGDMVSYLYVDGQLVGKRQLTNSNEAIEIQNVPTAIVSGEHKFQLAQYEADAEGGTVLTFKEQPFTITVEE